MLPLIFAILFAVVEYAWYLGAIHYVSYATFTAARAQQANDDPTLAAQALLTGRMVDMGTGDVRLSNDPSTGTVTSTLLWRAQLPGFRQVMGIMDVTMSTTLGPPECEYESRAATRRAGVTDNAWRYADNKLECN